MLLALRKDPPVGATLWQRFSCWVIRARLVSQYSHGGIVIDGALYHITSFGGAHVLQPGQWSPARWDLVDVGGDDTQAVELFRRVQAPPKAPMRRLIWRMVNGYDWFSLLAFAGPPVRVSWLRYCFELCWLMRTGEEPSRRVTPEALLFLAVDQ